MASDKNYQYPLFPEWSTADIITVTSFYQIVEAAYEQGRGVAATDILAAYRAFQQVVPQKFEEKQLGRDFETASGYSLYRTVQAARATQGQVRMKGRD